MNYLLNTQGTSSVHWINQWIHSCTVSPTNKSTPDQAKICKADNVRQVYMVCYSRVINKWDLYTVGYMVTWGDWKRMWLKSNTL